MCGGVLSSHAARDDVTVCLSPRSTTKICTTIFAMINSDLSPHVFNIVNLVTPIFVSDNDLSPHMFNIVNLVTPIHVSDSDLSPHLLNLVNLVTHQSMVLTMSFLRTCSTL